MAQRTLEARVSSLDNTVRSLEALPVRVAALDDRLSGVAGRLGTVESQIVELRHEVHDGFSAIRGEMATTAGVGTEFASIREEMATKAEMKAEFAAIRVEMATKAEAKAEFAAIRVEMATKAEVKAEFAAVREELATKADKSDLATVETRLRNEIAESRVHTRLLFEEYVGRIRIVDEGRTKTDRD